jgi:hypothetical protein
MTKTINSEENEKREGTVSTRRGPATFFEMDEPLTVNRLLVVSETFSTMS